MAPPAPAQRPSVLLVEDDPTLGQLLSLSLEPFADVELASSGRQALEVAASRIFSAVASDISLGDVSGLKVIAAIRATMPDAGIVAMTGMAEIEVAVNSMKAGADDFITKPFDPGMLWHTLNKAIDLRRQRTEADKAEAYRTLAYTDALTGCHNRRFIDECLAEAVDTARRESTPLTVAYFDLDNFKLLNNFAGFQKGDDLLQAVALIMTEEFREPSCVGRFGGDEFVAVLPGVTVTGAEAICARVRHRVAAVELLNGVSINLPVRVSVGLAQVRGTQTPRDLVAEAEDEMYVDKASMPLVALGDLAGGSARHAGIGNLRALRGLVKAIDRRDAYTRYHSDYATRLALSLAVRVGIDEASLNGIALGGPIHDLGKIVVPDEILRKPGPLTAEERRLMDSHPVMGAAITSAVIDCDAVVDLVRHHHERFDGAGYPAGLKGENITLATRLFSLGDAYSAMVTDRPYRKGLSVERALEQLRQGTGTQFDPDLAREFIRMLDEEAFQALSTAA